MSRQYRLVAAAIALLMRTGGASATEIEVYAAP